MALALAAWRPHEMAVGAASFPGEQEANRDRRGTRAIELEPGQENETILPSEVARGLRFGKLLARVLMIDQKSGPSSRREAEE